MASVSPFASPPPIRSVLFKNLPEAIPSTDELESLVAELASIKDKTIERAKKAGEELKFIEESWRRMKEKEKGKAKAVERVKREPTFIPLPNGDDMRASAPAQPITPQRSKVPPVSTSAAPPPSAPAAEVRKSTTEEIKKKKKKRKREELSDDEADTPKARKGSPLTAHAHSHAASHPPPPKVTKYPSSSTVFSKVSAAATAHWISTVNLCTDKPSNGQDFALPPQISLLPPRPPVQPAPVAGPSKPTEVREDFTKSRQPGQQVQVNTFYSSIEPWIRNVKEEDIGFLEHTGDDVEPFVMPKLGRHYSEVWEEEDIALYGGPLPGTAAMRAGARSHPATSNGPLPRWEPSTLQEADLLTEERGHGPLTERLVSALIPMHNATEWKGVKAAEEAMEGRPGTNGAAAAAARDKLNVADLEDRVKNVLRFHGLLEEIPDFSEAVDDPIATALRHAQRELRTVLATNKVRRARLAAIARDRLGYQEYVDLRDSIDKNISTLYAKLQKKDGPKKDKKKKKGTELYGAPAAAPTGLSALPPCPAALGLSPDEEIRLHVPEQLSHLVQTRRQWVDTVGGVFEEKQGESHGRIWGVPTASVYEGIEEEVQREMARLGPPASTSSAKPSAGSAGPANSTNVRTNGSIRASKGKERAHPDDMEIG
ncbi:hypothetical protein WOLCODRAFT_136374 [Wolfiporia cocos MD-104 SS10]|uniref:Uncharacterized protein n=1 Tax=Wolfiporia cocos (strain MD-104) TaxID=742152 RepID=A0A2H3J8Q6_WOLCO|nr:hypothetical protein WOLCODRAFT_136374 [Wolfiporia cocos MD-104 SS10]